MALTAIMKKISPKIRLIEGIRIPRCFNSTVGDTRDLNNEAVKVCDLEELLKHGWKVRKRTCWEENENDKRWDRWVYSSHELWQEKNEEEQRGDLNMRWKYLKDLLHREGIETSHHRLLLSMKEAEGYIGDGILELKVGSPDRGLISTNRLVIDEDRGSYTQHTLPRQTVNGLLCFVTHRFDTFFIYNPITGERSPWIDINKDSMKYSYIAFGYNPQSNEHKVICIKGNDSFSDQVVEIFTVGKNTWRRIDAIPPIPMSFFLDFWISYEKPFYVDGCLYWRFRREHENGELELIMRFDIVNEKFRVIPIPDFVINPLKFKRGQTVELTEIDGRVAVLDSLRSLWKLHEDADGNITWEQEIIDIMPGYWNGKPDLSIEALTGTNLIFLRCEWHDSIYYYNRDTKEAIRFPIFPDGNQNDWGRIIQV